MMSVSYEVVMRAASVQRVSFIRPEFSAILPADTNVVSIPRTLDRLMVERLTRLSEGRGFAHRVRLDAAELNVEPLLVSIPNNEDRAFLQDDITEMAYQLAALLDCRHLDVQLYTQRSDGCRKIHSDNVPLRIMCTYAGPGIDWLPESDLVRENLGPSELDAEIANRRVIRKGARLRRCSVGDILLLKGERYPGNAGLGAAHRSPPLEADGATRLVLKIDQARCGC